MVCKLSQGLYLVTRLDIIQERIWWSLLLIITVLRHRFWEGDRRLATKARTFHEPNLLHWIKCMKISASEIIRNACFNLERLSRSFRLARPGISPFNRANFGTALADSEAEIFMYRTQCINYNNVFCKPFDRNEHFSPIDLSSPAIKVGVWINSAGLNNLGRP